MINIKRQSIVIFLYLNICVKIKILFIIKGMSDWDDGWLALNFQGKNNINYVNY